MVSSIINSSDLVADKPPFNYESVAMDYGLCPVQSEVTPDVDIANIVTTKPPPSTGKPPVTVALDSNPRPHYQRRGGYRPRANPHRGARYLHNAPPMHIPFANNLIYRPDAASAMFHYPGPTQPMLFPFVDPVLHGNILNQIHYYFSNDNLVKDLYLRRNMDQHGWVSVNLIAGFKKISSMTDDVQIILHVMRSSALVEVQGDKMRRRNDWRKWLLPPVAHHLLASLLQGIGLSSKRTPSSGELQERADPV